MQNQLFVFIPALVLLLSACNKGGGSRTRAFGKPDNAPTVIDTLKDKSDPEILSLKYGGEKGEVKATCILEVEGPRALPTASPPFKPPGFVPPVQYPEENTGVYDIRAQAQVDLNLTQSAEMELSAASEGEVAKIKMNIDPVAFKEQLSLDFSNVKYIMKYTPVLTYKYEFTFGASTKSGDGLIYENVLTRVNLLRGRVLSVSGDNTTVGGSSYDLACSLTTTVNQDNEELKAEYESQWRCIGCPVPQSQ